LQKSQLLSYMPSKNSWNLKFKTISFTLVPSAPNIWI
jgi:hypothetical protein